MRVLVRSSIILIAGGVLFVGLAAIAGSETRAARSQDRDPSWVMLRTPEGHPDLQGNWTNATITPVRRPAGLDAVLTGAQVTAIEEGRQEFIETLSQPSDPDREAPPEGGVFTGDAIFDAASGGTGGYNYFFIDGGDSVAIYNGEPRSSLVVNPGAGRIPPLTPEERDRRRESAAAARRAGVGEYDNPENLSLGLRCLMSFGSNAGPPMLPNYFYNNSYTIVQTADHILIMTEMVHDVRIIRLGERKPLPDHVRPWMGDSWGRWEGDTLVVETTNLPAKQLVPGYVYPGGSADMKVTERFTRVDEDTINYEFTVDDPTTYTAPWGGEVPFQALGGLVYEYACHEANYSLFNVLSGARAQERGQR